jgi:hypothetical protein
MHPDVVRVDVMRAERAVSEAAHHALVLLQSGKTQQAEDVLARAVVLRRNAVASATRARRYGR